MSKHCSKSRRNSQLSVNLNNLTAIEIRKKSTGSVRSLLDTVLSSKDDIETGQPDFELSVRNSGYPHLSTSYHSNASGSKIYEKRSATPSSSSIGGQTYPQTNGNQSVLTITSDEGNKKLQKIRQLGIKYIRSNVIWKLRLILVLIDLCALMYYEILFTQRRGDNTSGYNSMNIFPTSSNGGVLCKLILSVFFMMEVPIYIGMAPRSFVYRLRKGRLKLRLCEIILVIVIGVMSIIKVSNGFPPEWWKKWVDPIFICLYMSRIVLKMYILGIESIFYRYLATSRNPYRGPSDKAASLLHEIIESQFYSENQKEIKSVMDMMCSRNTFHSPLVDMLPEDKQQLWGLGQYLNEPAIKSRRKASIPRKPKHSQYRSENTGKNFSVRKVLKSLRNASNRKPSPPPSPLLKSKRLLGMELPMVKDKSAADLDRITSLLAPASLDSFLFDTFELDKLSDGKPLTFISYILFQDPRHNLASTYNMDLNLFNRWLNGIENLYRNCPYHNSIHAADVVQAAHVIMINEVKYSFMSDMDCLSTFVAAIAHDVGHPGVNNQFLINSKSTLALRYNDMNILEQFHASLCFVELAKKNQNVFSCLNPEDFKILRSRVIQLILATDLKDHFSILSELKAKVGADMLNPLENPDDRLFMAKIVLKCADISHPIRSTRTHCKWTNRVIEEFFKQGDTEKALNLPVSQLGDRDTTDIPESQIGFITYLVLPLYKAFHSCTKVPRFEQMCINNINENLNYWKDVKSGKASMIVDII